MKKSMLIAIVLIFLLSAFSFSSCAITKALDESKEMLADYYDCYNDKDIDECMDYFNDIILDDLGGDDDAEIILSSRRELLGEMEDYTITSFDSESSFSQAQVILQLDVEYENASEIVEEEYIFLKEDDELIIIGIDVGDDSIISELIEGYFSNYMNMENIQKYYIPNTKDNYLDFDVLSQTANYAKEVGGEYKSHEITSYEYFFIEQTDVDDTFYIASIVADIEMENEDFVLEARISSQDGEVGFNYLDYYPKDSFEIIEQYFEKVANADTKGILDLYSPDFFSFSDVTSEDWETQVLKSLVNDYGEFIDYEITEWHYSLVPVNGVDEEMYIFYILSYYDTATAYETILINKDGTSQVIMGHQIE